MADVSKVRSSGGALFNIEDSVARQAITEIDSRVRSIEESGASKEDVSNIVTETELGYTPWLFRGADADNNDTDLRVEISPVDGGARYTLFRGELQLAQVSGTDLNPLLIDFRNANNVPYIIAYRSRAVKNKLGLALDEMSRPKSDRDLYEPMNEHWTWTPERDCPSDFLELANAVDAPKPQYIHGTSASGWAGAVFFRPDGTYYLCTIDTTTPEDVTSISFRFELAPVGSLIFRARATRPSATDVTPVRIRGSLATKQDIVKELEPVVVDVSQQRFPGYVTVNAKPHVITTVTSMSKSLASGTEIRITPERTRNFEIYIPNTVQTHAGLPLTFKLDDQAGLSKFGDGWNKVIENLPALITFKEPFPKQVIATVTELTPPPSDEQEEDTPEEEV